MIKTSILSDSKNNSRIKVITNYNTYSNFIKLIFEKLIFYFSSLSFYDPLFIFLFYMLEKGYSVKNNYFSKYEILKINLDEKFLNNEKSYQNNFILIVGGFIIERILVLNLMKMENNKKDKRFLFLATLIDHIFLDFLKEKQDFNKIKSKKYYNLLIKNGILNFNEDMVGNNKSEIIFGLINETEFRNFLNEKKKLFFKSFFSSFFEILYKKFLKCKKMITDLEKLEPMKEKLLIIEHLKNLNDFDFNNNYSRNLNFYKKEYFNKN